MPIAPTYPGVYVEEIPSGVRTITGVATSITAFVGRALCGPVNEPITINSFGDFERQFGGLAIDYPMSYAVSDFYRNGGGKAIIVRLFSPAGSGVAQLTAGGLKLVASSPGTWANGQTAVANGQTVVTNGLTATVDVIGITPDVASRYGLQPADLFNLTVTEMVDGRTASQEKFSNLIVKQPDTSLSAAARARRVDRVLAQSSQLVAIPLNAKGLPDLPAAPPTPPPAAVKVISPVSGAAAGGTTVIIIGNGFTGATAVNFGANPATAMTVNSDTQISATSPAGTAGSVDVVVVGSGGPSAASAADKFEYKPAAGAAPAPAGGAPAPAPAPAGGAPAPAPAAGAPAAGPPIATGGADSQALQDVDYLPVLGEAAKTGIYALAATDLFNLLCIPPDVPGGDTSTTVYSSALDYCYLKRRAMLIVDSPSAWSSNPVGAANNAVIGLPTLGLTGDRARNAALYFPRVIESDILSKGQLESFVPCGIIAGIMAATDAQRGVWKAPAGLDAGLSGIVSLEVNLTNDENGMLNPLGINCLRTFPLSGSVVWGARTLRGADQLADDYKYVPVRRLTLFLEESLYRGTQWVVFEPNDEPLWAQIRLNVGAFMHNLFVQGAFQGQTPTDAYFVKCDKNTTTQNDINLGVVNIVVGFAPLKPAEFVIIQIQQIAGNILT